MRAPLPVLSRVGVHDRGAVATVAAVPWPGASPVSESIRSEGLITTKTQPMPVLTKSYNV